MRDLRTRVFEALDQAKVNGYAQQDLPVDELVDDLINFCSDVQEEFPWDLAPHVREWQEKMKAIS